MDMMSQNNISVLQSKKIKCPHGFSTRLGGVSTADLLESLNLTISSRNGETYENVIENLNRFCNAIGVRKESVYAAPQCNGNNIVHVTSEDAGTGYYKLIGPAFFVKNDMCYDGYVTREHGVTIGIRTTDCLPILFAHMDQGHIDVVAGAHVGCRDDFAQPTCNITTIVPKVIEEMNCDSQNIMAVLGPCGEKCCAKVSDVIIEMMEHDLGWKGIDPFCKKSEGGKWSVDMRSLNTELLLECGILSDNIDSFNLCTCCNKNMFFSHIRDGRKTGSMLAAIALPTN